LQHRMNRFTSMLVFQEHRHTVITVLINRTLFDRIQMLISDSDDVQVEAPSKAATAQASAPPPVQTAPLNLEASVRQKSRMEMLSLNLEIIITKAAAEGDQTLTKRTCRDKLKTALGFSTLDPTDLD
jgi:hypothetical protein